MNINITLDAETIKAINGLTEALKNLSGLGNLSPNVQVAASNMNLTPPVEKTTLNDAPVSAPVAGMEFQNQAASQNFNAGQVQGQAVEPVMGAAHQAQVYDQGTGQVPGGIPTSGVSYTRADLAVGARTLMDAGRLGELQGLLQKYSVASLAELPEQNFAMFAADLRNLGVNI